MSKSGNPSDLTRREFVQASVAAVAAAGTGLGSQCDTTHSTSATPAAAKKESRMNVPPMFGPYGSSAIKHLARFDECGANALWFHGFNADAFEACEKHNVRACVEFKTFRENFNDRPELIPTGVDGKPIRFGRLVQGVCLSNAEFLAKTEENLVKGVAKYRPAGIWFDYLTYAGWFEQPDPDLQESCFCSGCMAEFCQATNIDATDPKEILAKHQQAWTRHKCERIAGFARHYVGIIRKKLPDCIVGAYMCPWTPQEFDGALTRIFAQDYQLLAPYIDVFTPLIYCTKSGRKADWGRQFLTSASEFVPADREVLLILDMLEFPDSLLAAAESPKPSWGVQMFHGAELFEDPARMKIFAEAAEKIRKKIASGTA